MTPEQLPQAFVEQMQAHLGQEWPDFLAALEGPVPVSVLLNSEKPIEPEFELEADVPWCLHGRYLSERPSFTLDPLFHAGCYYVMEASSMLLWEVLTQLDLHTRPVRVLDLCAAPGGKSAILLNRLHPESCLVVNEVSAKRNAILQHNTAKWGRSNVVITQLDPARIPDSGLFDCVVVDAPCSGEGLFRKTPDAVRHWSSDHVKHCAARQQRILKEAARLLGPGGTLIYSTCTYQAEENIRQVARLQEAYAMQSLEVKLPTDWGIAEVRQKDATGYQCFPHRLQGEGFFISALRHSDSAPPFKPQRNNRLPWSTTGADTWSSWLDADDLHLFSPAQGAFRALTGSAFAALRETAVLRSGRAGTLLGRIKGTDIVPDHMLALSALVHPDVQRLELSHEQALSYLRREQPDGRSTESGWILATYREQPLGWLKQTRGPLKNQYPMSLRVRMT